ncbi:MAG: DUF389 domain-containing protein [Chitinophagales bacterium]
MGNSTNSNFKDSPFVFLRQRLIELFDIRQETDKQGTIDSIRQYTQLKGYNVWILIAAAMLASIGLDQNSPAVIIGAMLISPLMSPILGIGLSIGINDRETFVLSTRSLLIAMVASILVSYLYFLITPLGVPTDQLMARTKPTLLDVGVALFGGIAGIVAGSHKDKTNALPGVAIATALMPPLCTVGFGLAIADPIIAGGAFYLFFINAVIISTTTFVFVRIMKFPVLQPISAEEGRKTNWMIGVFVVLITIPSIFILLDTIDHIRRNVSINKFVESRVVDEDREVIDWEEVEEADVHELKVYVVGANITEDTVMNLQEAMHKMPKLEESMLKLVQVNLSERDRASIRSDARNDLQKDVFWEVSKQIAAHKEELEDLKQLGEEVKQLREELKEQTSSVEFANYNGTGSSRYADEEEEEDEKEDKGGGLFGKNKDKDKEDKEVANINESRLDKIKEESSGQVILKRELRVKKTYNGNGFTEILSPAKNAIVGNMLTLVLKDNLKEDAEIVIETQVNDLGDVYIGTMKAGTNRFTVNFTPRSKFPKGLYYWNLRSDEGKMAGKFYIE